MDKAGFCQDIIALRKHYYAKVSEQDVSYMRRVVWLNRSLFCFGCLSAWHSVNLFSMVMLSLYFTSQWCTVAHHILHGCFDDMAAAPKAYQSKYFAQKWRRFFDWNDWLLAKPWCYEHNIMHHLHTNEPLDPDRVRHVLLNYGLLKLGWLRGFVVILAPFFWKPLYYVVNTLKVSQEKQQFHGQRTLLPYLKKAMLQSYLPYVGLNFILFPLLFFPLGMTVMTHVLLNRIGAELLTNLHTFFIIVPNHTAADIPCFDTPFVHKEEFFYRQLVTAYNYRSPMRLHDFFFGHLNYQIEHHLMPKAAPSQFRAIRQDVKALCQKHQLPYQERSILVCIWQLLKVMFLTKKDAMAII